MKNTSKDKPEDDPMLPESDKPKPKRRRRFFIKKPDTSSVPYEEMYVHYKKNA